MFRKINNVFHPNHPGRRGRDGGGGGGGGFRSEQDYHNACTVRLVRSTSMLVVGEKTQAAASSTLKRSKSTVSIESTLYYYQRQEDRIWLYSQNQNCLEYLEALVALRRQYTKSVSDLKSSDTKATVSAKKKPAPPPPTKEEPISRAKPSAPPVPSEEDTLQFFDAVIAGCDSEPLRKPYMDDGHADVDFIAALHLQSELQQEVKRSAPDTSGPSPSQEELSRSAMGANTDTMLLEAQAILLGLLEGGEAQENQDCSGRLPDSSMASSSAEHDLHSNWVLRVPRVADDSKQKAVHDRANESAPKKKNQSGSTSSRLRLQRNPIHLPKVVESAFQTLRFKPKLKKQ